MRRLCADTLALLSLEFNDVKYLDRAHFSQGRNLCEVIVTNYFLI